MDQKPKLRSRFTLIWVVVLSLVIGGCDKLPLPFGKKTQEEKKIVVTRKPPPKVSPSPAPAVPSPKKEEKRNYVYNPTGRRDPFRPFIAMQTPVTASGEQIPLTPLQKYDLSQLKLVAILVGKKEGRAMVEDSEGKGYIVKKMTYIGRNFGRVKAILKDRVIIEEKYKDYRGSIRQKEIVMRLRAPGEGKRP